MDARSIEILERRVLCSFVALRSTGQLDVVGNQATPNTIIVGYSPGRRYIVVKMDGQPHAFKRDSVTSLRIFGGDEADFIKISEARAKFDKNCRIVGGAGNDTILCGSENDVVFTDAGDNFVSLGNGDDAAVGGDGNNRILGGDGLKVIFGGAGDDVIEVGNGHGYIFGQNGNDAISTRGGGHEIFGDAGNDTLIGGHGDTIWGGGGTDVLHGGSEVHTGEFPGVNSIIKSLMPVEPSVPMS